MQQAQQASRVTAAANGRVTGKQRSGGGIASWLDKMQLPSRQFLKTAWLNLISSYFLTYIYIFIHTIGAYLLTPFTPFSKPGEEWLPDVIPRQQRKQASKWLEVPEIIFTVLIGVIISVLLFFVINLVVIMVYPFVDPLGSLNFLGRWIYCIAINC